MVIALVTAFLISTTAAPFQHPDPSRVAGISWTKPSRWSVTLPKQMRVVTYAITDPKSASDPAECGVFFFGEGQGGSVQDNIDRWSSQFEGTPKAKTSSKMVGGLKVTTVQISGTYSSPGGPMMQSQGNKKNYRLLGAIIEAPEGPVFFKTTGPAKTIAAIEKEFDALVNSVKK